MGKEPNKYRLRDFIPFSGNYSNRNEYWCDDCSRVELQEDAKFRNGVLTVL